MPRSKQGRRLALYYAGTVSSSSCKSLSSFLFLTSTSHFLFRHTHSFKTMTRTSRRVLPAVLVVAAYLACLVAAHGQPRTHLESRGQPNGWINAQPSEDAQTYFFPVRPSSGSSTTVVSNSTDTASIYAYIDQGALDTAASRAKLKRVVIQIHGELYPSLRSSHIQHTTLTTCSVDGLEGKGRDCWNYFDHTRVARTEAIKQSNGLVKKGEVLLVAPNFWINTDRRAFPYEAGKGGTSDLMVWKGNDWSEYVWARFTYQGF